MGPRPLGWGLWLTPTNTPVPNMLPYQNCSIQVKSYGRWLGVPKHFGDARARSLGLGAWLASWSMSLPARVTAPNLVVLGQTIWANFRRSASKRTLASRLSASLKVLSTDTDRAVTHDCLLAIRMCSQAMIFSHMSDFRPSLSPTWQLVYLLWKSATYVSVKETQHVGPTVQISPNWM